MKRKSPRGIPDFAPKPKGFKQQAHPELAHKAEPVAPPPPQPKVKTPHTSAKGSQRGG